MRDEVVLITGGSSGIGLATAERFLRRGARVWLTARDEKKLQRAADSLGGSVHFLPADTTSASGWQQLLGTIREREGKLDVLLYSAGQLQLGPAEESVDAAERLMRVNYLGLVRGVASALPLLRNGSRKSIVCLSSFVGRLAPPYWSAYAASKHAVQAYAHALRQELRSERFHVGLVLPGPVDSPMTENLIGTPMYPLPTGLPVITPDRVANAILQNILRRRAESTVPGHFGPLLRLGSAFPRLVDLFYRPIRS